MSPGSLARSRSRVLVDVADHDDDDVSSEAERDEEEDAGEDNVSSCYFYACNVHEKHEWNST